jgi:GNAT superfamily N-acetyltransferase
MGITYESTFEPSKDLVKIIEDGLDKYNESIIGGLSGWLFWDWLYIDRLWVAEGERGNGTGRHLVLEAERMALERGIKKSHLSTTSFQALDFYLALGYSVYGQLEDLPRGHTTYYLRKNL